MVPAKPSSGRMICIVHVHGLLLSHHLGLQAEADHVAGGDIEGESEDQPESGHQQISDGRGESNS